MKHCYKKEVRLLGGGDVTEGLVNSKALGKLKWTFQTGKGTAHFCISHLSSAPNLGLRVPLLKTKREAKNS